MARHRKSEDYHHGNLREACLKEGIKLLKKNGPEKLSLRDIARRLKVSPGAPYRHFKTKQDLLAAIATWGFRRFAEYLDGSSADSLPPEERFREMGHSFLRFANDFPDVFRLMFSGIIEDYCGHPELIAAGNIAYSKLMSCVKNAQAHGRFVTVDSNRIAIHSLAMMYGYCSLMLNGRLSSLNIGSDSAHDMLNEMNHDMMFGLLTASARSTDQ